MKGIDGQWQEWGDWSDCDPSCSCGNKLRARSCTSSTIGGKECVGNSTDMAPCSPGCCTSSVSRIRTPESDYQPSCQNVTTPGNTNSTSIEFFEDVFTVFNESVTVSCCHPNNTVRLATCGLGASCAGGCSALGAKLCPSGDCTGDCGLPFEEEATRVEQRRWFGATEPSIAFGWCSPRCNVRRRKGCCYNPVCRRKRRKACQWFNFLAGDRIV